VVAGDTASVAMALHVHPPYCEETEIQAVFVDLTSELRIRSAARNSGIVLALHCGWGKEDDVL
jgi:hypothetical protein